MRQIGSPVSRAAHSKAVRPGPVQSRRTVAAPTTAAAPVGKCRALSVKCIIPSAAPAALGIAVSLDSQSQRRLALPSIRVTAVHGRRSPSKTEAVRVNRAAALDVYHTAGSKCDDPAGHPIPSTGSKRATGLDRDIGKVGNALNGYAVTRVVAVPS